MATGARATAQRALGRSPGLMRHRVALISYGYNSKFSIKGNRKLLTTYVIIPTWQLLISASALRSLSGV